MLVVSFLWIQLVLISVGVWRAQGRQFPSARKEIQIGAIFHADEEEAEVAFLSAIEWVNMQQRDFEFMPLIKHTDFTDSYKTGMEACELASEGVAAIFGPSSRYTSGIVSSIANALEIPHLMTHWQPYAVNPDNHRMTVNVYPDSEVLAAAIVDLVDDYDWTSFAIIYDEDDALVRLKDVVSKHGPDDNPIVVRQLDEGDDQRPLLKSIQDMGENRIILDVHPDRVIELLHQADEVKLFGDYVSFIIINLDTHTLDFGELMASGTNITGLRLVKPDHDELQYMVQMWKQKDREIRIQGAKNYTLSGVFADAVKVFSTVFFELDSTEEIEVAKLDCENPEPWEHGARIVEFMKKKEEEGLTGSIAFNELGERTTFSLEIIELSKHGFVTIGIWDPTNKVQYLRSEGDVQTQIIESLGNKTFIVSSRIGPPFLMWREAEEGQELEGNARFEGYSIDLIDAISKILGFKYVFELVPDGKYGGYNKETKKWDGLVKQLLDRKADMAICDLTITYARRTAVDFTMPFMTLGISILYAKPEEQPPDLFSFLSPLSGDVWLFMGMAYLGVSLLLFVLARMAPQDWENPHPCTTDNEEVENIWDLLNSTWLTMGSIMGQGCDILPKSISTRIVAGSWWFFALIMLASYTANLAAFLTMSRMDATIENVEDLAAQSKIKYGVLEGGSTYAFFRDSNFSIYQKMWAVMESTRPTVFTKSNDEGKDRVSKEKGAYAFFMESTTLEYIVERNCELQQIGGLLDSKGYGIAMPMNSPYRTAISGAVLKLAEEGRLLMLKTKWWKEMGGGGQCDEAETEGPSDTAELGIENVGGVFYVLYFGLFCAFVIGIAEFLWTCRKIAVETGESQWSIIVRELKFVFNFHITTKPVQKGSSLGEEVGDTDNNIIDLVVENGGGNGNGKSFSRQTSENLSTKLKNSLMNLNKIDKFFTKKDSE